MVTLVFRLDNQTSDNRDFIGYITVVYQKYTTNFHWRFCTGHDIDVVLIYPDILSMILYILDQQSTESVRRRFS